LTIDNWQFEISFWLVWCFGALYLAYLLLRAAQRVLRLLVCWGRFGRRFAEFVEWKRRRDKFADLRDNIRRDRRRRKGGS
jgi:hypothetical protein